MAITNEEINNRRILDLTSPVGALSAFLGKDGVDSGFPDGTGGGRGVLDLGACDEGEDC